MRLKNKFGVTQSITKICTTNKILRHQPQGKVIVTRPRRMTTSWTAPWIKRIKLTDLRGRLIQTRSFRTLTVGCSKLTRSKSVSNRRPKSRNRPGSRICSTSTQRPFHKDPIVVAGPVPRIKKKKCRRILSEVAESYTS